MESLYSNISYRLRNSNAFEKIIFLNIGVYISYLILELFSLSYINEYFALTSDYLYNPWSIITYAFIHQGFYELIFMLILIYYSSSKLINLYGEKIPIRIFFTGIILGGLFFLLFFNGNEPLIGSSAGACALLFFMLCYMPNHIIKISFIKFEFKYLMYLLFFMDIIRLFANKTPDGGLIAHLGGYLAGFYHYTSVYGIGDFKRFYKQRKPRNKKNKSPADFSEQKRIDIILDKISKSGYDSLSKSEKEYLFKSDKK
jgi:membrane associated rhomboid family serine protease